VAGIATARTVEQSSRRFAQIKWPNDVLVESRKVAGVLAEATGDAVVVGIGMNVNQTTKELPAHTKVPAASLYVLDSIRRDRAPILADLLLQLEQAYRVWCDEGLGALHDELEQRDFLRGRRLVVDGETGVGITIDSSGRLEIEIRGRRRLVESGEIDYEG
jgi:BirA family biotin operon repressor/biotin-[acetyl-CoA-carboxylase] ligase